MTATMTPRSRSLVENLANAHITSGTGTATTIPNETTAASLNTKNNAGSYHNNPTLPIFTPLHHPQQHSTEERQQLTSITNHDDGEPFSLERHEKDGYYVLPKCRIPAREKFGPVEEFVAKAVKSRLLMVQTTSSASGGGENNSSSIKTYKVILEAIRRKEDPSLLHMIFLAIRTSDNGSTLHQLSGNPTKHAQLLHVLLRFDPFFSATTTTTTNSTKPGSSSNKKKSKKDIDDPFRNYSIADAYFHLVLALVSANSVFLVPSMTSIWKLLTSLNNEDPPVARTQRIHATLAALTRLCPKAKTEIFPIMSANFPFRTAEEKQLVWCYKQVFAVSDYVPTIQTQVLQFVIDKSLEMDVEIKIHDGGQVSLDDDRKEDDDDDDIFDLELDDSTPKTQKQQQPKEDITVDEMADKLDVLMLLTLEYLQGRGQNDVIKARSLYERCLPAFESSILITHRSKFVQFILFYLCGLEGKALKNNGSNRDDHLMANQQQQEQQHATLYREFCADLIGLIFDPYRSTVVRQCAVCYLASFVSRARYAEADTICESLSALLQWAEAYIASVQTNSVCAADVREQCDLHLLFYTISQAAFYIMCFRGKEAVKFYRSVQEMSDQPPESIPEHLRDVELQQVDISPARWSRLCEHKLQPLKYCLGTVKEEFLNVATTFNLLNSDLAQRLTAEHQRQSSALRKKKATVIRAAASLQHARSNGGVGGLGKGSNPLDSFFPFDPYLLRRSHPYIEQFYRYWGEDDVSEDDEDSVDAMDAMDDEEDASSNESDASDDDSDSSDEEEDRRQTSSFDYTLSTPPSSPALLTAPRESWTETLKRARAPSIENGSW